MHIFKISSINKAIFLTTITLISQCVFSQVAGPNNPILVTNNGAGNSWDFPLNASTENGLNATNATKGNTSKLQATNFGFALLGTNNINGIQLDVKRRQVQGPNINRLNSWTEREGHGITNYTIPAGNERMLMVVIGAENGTTQATYSVSYNGVALTKATSITANTGFTAHLDVWYLQHANMPAGASTANIVVTATAPSFIEYLVSTSAAVYANVDQTNPFQSFITGSTTTNTATYTFPTAMTNAPGAMAFTAIFCGQNKSPGTTNGGTNCWSIGNGFTEGIDVYRSNPSVPNTGGSLQVADKSYVGSAIDQPVITFAGTPNRRCAIAISFRRSSVYDVTTRLLKNNVEVGANYSLYSTPWPLTNAYQSYGGPTDLWGTTWSTNDINNINFGAVYGAFVDQGTAEVDHMRLTVFYSSTLPIDLIDFTALRSEDGVELNWITATETNSSSIEIQRSIDGFEFETIHQQNASGTSIEPLLYQHMDNRVPQGIVYYRLKLIDKDGTFTYSDIKSVSGLSNQTVLFPNPINDWGHIFSENEVDQIVVYDQTGRMVDKPQYYAIGDKLSIDFQHLENGKYILYLQEGGKKKMLHFQKLSR